MLLMFLWKCQQGCDCLRFVPKHLCPAPVFPHTQAVCFYLLIQLSFMPMFYLSRCSRCEHVICVCTCVQWTWLGFTHLQLCYDLIFIVIFFISGSGGVDGGRCVGFGFNVRGNSEWFGLDAPLLHLLLLKNNQPSMTDPHPTLSPSHSQAAGISYTGISITATDGISLIPSTSK